MVYIERVDTTPEEEPNETGWYIDCQKHGQQQALPETVKHWDQETAGSFGKKEFWTADCPICLTSRLAHQQIVHQDEETLSKAPTSEHR